MKRIHLRFFAPECLDLQEALAIDLSQTTCDLVVGDPADEVQALLLEKLLINGDPAKGWWFNMHAETISDFILAHLDYHPVADGATVTIGGGKYVSEHLLGSPVQRYIARRFDTEAEKAAYETGLNDAFEWSGLLPLGEADEADLDALRANCPSDYRAVLKTHPDLLEIASPL